MIELATTINGEVSSLPLYPLYMGREQCDPGYRYGRVRGEYLIHYVSRGGGTFQTESGAYRLGRGMAFVIRPGEEHWYEADHDNPWEYWWLGFRAPPEQQLCRWAGVTALPAAVALSESNIREFEAAYERLWGALSVGAQSGTPILFLEALTTILRVLFVDGSAGKERSTPPSGAPTSPQLAFEDYTGWGEEREEAWAQVTGFLNHHFAEPISVEQVCRWVGVSRASLHRLSVRKTGLSPKELLTRLRMERAATLLCEQNGPGGEYRPVSRIAALCGYREYQTFERAFRRRYGVTPTEYRRRC